MTTITKSIQVVRNFNQNGGMERYVWALAHALAERNQEVVIVCQSYDDSCSKKIKVHKLNGLKSKSGWVNHLFFSNQLNKFLSQHLNYKEHIIHSHERISCHHVTTFHSPLIKDREKGILDILSVRLMVWNYIENRELFGRNLQCILPNSFYTAKKIETFYPDAQKKICAPAFPGVDQKYYSIETNPEGLNIGFIGRDWKRKGLAFVVEIFSDVIKKINNVHLYVAGPEFVDIQHLFVNLPRDKFTIMNWTDPAEFFKKINLLVHPAIKEPFGMVLAEANASGKYILASKNTGFTKFLTKKVGKALELNKENWLNEILKYNSNRQQVQRLNFSWNDLAKKHEEIYLKIKS